MAALSSGAPHCALQGVVVGIEDAGENKFVTQSDELRREFGKNLFSVFVEIASSSRAKSLAS